MKQFLRRLCCVILTLTFFLTALPAPASAAERDLSYEQLLAADLKDLGLFAGVSDTDFALGRAPTRVEALVMLMRLLGVEHEVTAGNWPHPFTDVPEWADQYIGYAYIHGLTSGEGADRFGTGNADAAIYLTFVLRALGYSDRGANAEFTWDDPFSLARTAGILPNQVSLSPFWRADVVTVSYAALGAAMNGGSKTLAEKLIENGAFTQEQFDLYYHPDYLIVSKTPSEWIPLSSLGMGCVCGYAEPNGFYNSTLLTNYTAYGSIPAAKGTKIRFLPGSYKLAGFEAWQYDEDGNYVSKLGNVHYSLEELTTTVDGYVIIYASWKDSTDMQAATRIAAEQFQLYFPARQQLLLWKNPQTVHPFRFEIGYLDRGKPYPSTDCMRSTDFLTVGAGTHLFHLNYSYVYAILRYDFNGKFIEGITNSWQCRQVYTIPQDCLIKVLIRRKDSKAINQQDIDAAQQAVAVDLRLPSPDFGILPPEYYFTGQYLPERIAKINAFSAEAESSDQFIFATDIHWDSNFGRSPYLMRYVAEHTEVKRVIFGGDAITNYATKADAITAMQEFRQKYSYFTDEQWLSVLGNHEFNNPSALPASAAQLTESEARAAFLSSQADRVTTLTPYLSYWDNEPVKIRYFLLGLNYASRLPRETVSAFLSALTEIPEDHSVVLISHAGLNSKDEVDASVKDIIGALDAVRTRTSYRYSGKSYNYSVLKNVTVVCALTGHRHKDGAIITATGLPVISTVCDASIIANPANAQQARTQGTITEQAFDVVQIDLKGRQICLTRIGAGEDRIFTF